MKLMKALLAVIALPLLVGTAATSQTVAVNGIGSSALFLEMGQAAALSPTIGASCTWTKGSGTVSALDGRAGVGLTENGQVWVAWQPGTGTCAAPAGTYKIYSYLQTDSTVGNRCVFAAPACTLVFPSSTVGTAGANLLAPVVDVTAASGGLPAAIQTALNGVGFTVAGTDIRPEDAKFATIRALTACGSPVNGVTGSQYLGLGYAVSANSHIGNAIKGATLGGGSSFNVVDFNLTGTDPISGNAVSSFSVYDVGAVPVVVFVNPSDINGFGSILVQNITRGNLAGYLDGTYGRASDLIDQSYNGSSGASAVATTVFIREPLSGTYNTMEYGIPNNTQLQTSQDVGLNAPVAIDPLSSNCAAGVVSQNPLQDTVVRSGAGTSGRYRAIGTGNLVTAVLSHTDSLGYSFWGTGNFKNATALNAKYLTVDGVDPIQQVWMDGLVPTAGNGLLGNVSFANVKNGSYPIWSKLRLAAIPAGASGASALASAAQSYVSPQQPDFVPVNQLLIVRSHFAPPYNASSVYSGAFPSSGTNQPANGTSICNAGSTPEVGGDVGGLPYSIQSDGDFCTDSGSTVGQVGRRQ
jgi:hypothetical protein